MSRIVRPLLTCMTTLLVELFLISPTRAHQKPNSESPNACKLRIIRQPKTKWPKHFTGSKSRVGLKFRVERSGQVTHIEVVNSSGNKQVDKALVDCLRGTVYAPLVCECDYVESTMQVNIDFSA
jgi:TonB family protein